MNSDVVTLLQELTNLKSVALLDLYNAFEKLYPNEKNVKAILFNFIFSDNKCSEYIVVQELEHLKSRKI